jgi:hypothetical protein
LKPGPTTGQSKVLKGNSMTSMLFTVPIILVLALLAVAIARSLLKVWLDYRLKMSLLQRMEDRPELIQSMQNLTENPISTQKDKNKQDFLFTGIFLTLIGAVAACVALYIGAGRWAVGAYFGGISCVLIGFLLAFLGLIVRYLTNGANTKANSGDV